MNRVKFVKKYQRKRRIEMKKNYQILETTKRDYLKISSQTSGYLVAVIPQRIDDDLSWSFKEYHKTEDLPHGEYQLLVFIGDQDIPFSILVKPKIDKETGGDFYNEHLCEWFEIKIKKSNE